MTQVAVQRPSLRPQGITSKAALKLLMLFPVGCAMLAALIMVGIAGYENFRFARGLEQYLNLIGVARHYAEIQPGFAQQPGEDILSMLGRNGQIEAEMQPGNGARIVNPWGGDMRATLSDISVLRIDALVPVHACRRLGAYFSKIAKDFGLIEFAAHEEGTPWRLAYNGNVGRNVSESEFEPICGSAANVALTIMVRLR